MKPTTVRSTWLGAAVTAILLGLPAYAHAQASTLDLDLVCNGVGEKLEGQTDYDWDHKHHEFKEHTSLGTAQVGGTAQVEIHDGQGRVRLPKSLLPVLSSGGSGNWFPIHDLNIGADRITGSVKINGLNKPGLSIDRRSGRLKLDGMESFDATCSPFNPATTKF